MKAEPFAGTTNLLRAPPGFEHPVLGDVPDVPAFIGNGVVVSVWRPSEGERALLIGGGLLVLTVLGNNQAPCKIEVVHAAAADMGMARG